MSASPELDFLPRITGCFSTPARPNPTVAMIEAAYRHHQIHARYLNCEVAAPGLRDAVAGARAMGWIGFNCSLPHKVAVVEYLDELAKSASLIGAVNCVVNRDGRWIGENTDGQGFLLSLREKVDPSGKRMVLLGAGGAARAIAVETALAGIRSITVVNRDCARGESLARTIAENTSAQVEFVPWDGDYRIPGDVDVVVNATSIGFYPEIGATPRIDFETVRANMTVADVIPNPPRTPLIRRAEARGCATLDGLGMLVNQGVVGIKLWTGISVEAAVMRRTLEAVLRII
jgi:shikimate dehydrogenase